MKLMTIGSRTINTGSLLLAAAAVAVGGALAFAAGVMPMGNGPRIATVNLGVLTQHLDVYASSSRKFAAEQKSMHLQLAAKRKALRQLAAPLDPNATISFKRGSEEYLRQRKLLLKAEVALQVYQQYQEIRFREQERLVAENAYRQINQAVAKYATAHHITIVLATDTPQYDLPKSADLIEETSTRKVLYSSDSIDITNNIIRLMNRDYQKKHGQ